MIYNEIINKTNSKKLFTLLVDPDEYSIEELKKTVEIANISGIDYFFVGGSLISSFDLFENAIQTIKEKSEIPVLIFPGSYLHVSPKADGILLLNLISGRNPDYLIGNHVLAARKLKNSGIEIIPTGYILIENGKTTSVEYISNTKPIPADKHDIIVSTAIAGELMGHRMIYLEAGSGAMNPVHREIIKKVKSNINIPLIVGGGIDNRETLEKIYDAGADMVVVGNAIEKQPEVLATLCL